MQKGGGASSSASDWILSERRPGRTRTVQSRLVLYDHQNDNTNSVDSNKDALNSKPSLRRASSSFSSSPKNSPRSLSPKQTTLHMSLNKSGTSQPDKTVVAEKSQDQDRGKGKSKGMGKGKSDRDGADEESLAAIQRKVTEFQPKIDALLPRMMGKGPISPTQEPEADRAKTRVAKPSAPTPFAALATTITTATSSTAAATTTRPAHGKAVSYASTTSPAVAAGSSMGPSRSRSKKTSAPPITSVAALIPKGSRAKPLPSRAALEPSPPTPFVQSPSNTHTGNLPERAIVLSASLPSTLSMDNIEPTLPLLERATGSTIGMAANTTTAAFKPPSIISIDSSKSYDLASMVPSVQTGWITHWMGGVKDAMEEQVQESEQQQKATTKTSLLAGTEIETETDPKDTTHADKALKATNPALQEPRRPGLRRAPPGIPRHTDKYTTSSRSPSPLDIVKSSLEQEGEPLSLTKTLDDAGSKGKRVLIKDSLPSVPPVPLFHEVSDLSKDHDAGEGSTSKRATVVVATSTGAGQRLPTKGPYRDEDMSTVVGRRPTQDSFVGASSLPVSMNEKVEKEEEERDDNNDPSLPSALTSSCLEELGLKRKKSERQSALRKRRTGTSLGAMDEHDEEREQDAGNSLILAQEEAFPASIGAAPVSPSPSLSQSASFSRVLETPVYTFAVVDRTNFGDRDPESTQSLTRDESALYLQPGQRQGYDPDHSFPSPPSQLISLSTLPTMPTLPTIPSFPSLPSMEPTPMDLDENDSEEEEEQARWSQARDESQEQGQSLGPYMDPTMPLLPSQMSLSSLPTMPSFPSMSELDNNEPSLIILGSQDPSIQDDQ
ncbi:hypothetical protein BGZ98_002535 [Dissophora globulifera]|nr:hypothetical protein BGZ98_002535 [Dissophora globulifera]